MWHMFALESRYELMKMLRLRVFAAMTVGFPVMFYLLFGIAMNGSRAMGGRSLALPMLGTYGAFGVIGAALFSFGVNIAVERAQGWLLLKRATPMPPSVYVFGKVFASLTFCAVIVLVLAALASAFGGVRLTMAQWAGYATVLVLGSIPFCALGLAIGFVAGPNSAPGLVNLFHLPAAFASGLWMPLELLPPLVRAIAPWLPQYHLAQLALSTIGQDTREVPWIAAAALTAWTVVALGLAVVAFRRDAGRLYG